MYKIHCEHCGKNLSFCGPMPSYMITLSYSSIQNEGGVVFSVLVHPPYEDEHHFCSKICLKEFVNNDK